MDIKAALLKEHSKKQTQLITDYIGNNQERFDELMDLFLHSEDGWRVPQRAAWVLSYCADKHIALFDAHLPSMVDYLEEKESHIAVKRNIMRTLAQIDIPETLAGKVVNACFTFLEDPKEAIAVKVHAMETLYNICEKEPDLASELILLIQVNMEYPGTPGIQSRGRKIIKKLKKEGE